MIKDVSAYIAAAPKSVRPKLKQLRTIIKKTAPKATEKLSYQMPYYGYRGRLVYFACARSHIGLYIPPPVLAEHKQELTSYSTTKATVRFPFDKPLPASLIRRLIKTRMKKNEEKARKK